ncbi:MAG: F0F1 ATP synthase subunit gamma [Coriobacteriia bacterium]|nr:F0F1 ATP synthase subunit gamma [Coriobacteriia bacterium]
MEKLGDVRKRMQGVEGIGEVCRTLATVASAKLARTHERARGAHAYAARLREMLARQQAAARAAGRDPAQLSELMAERPQVTRALLLVVGADRGLCGGYNLAVGREARTFAASLVERGIDVTAIAKGRRAETYLRRATSLPIDDASGWSRAGVTDDEIDRLLALATDRFLAGEVDEVWATYTAFLSTMRREPRTVRLLPVMPEETAGNGVPAVPTALRWCYEPDQAACVHELLGAFVRLQVEDVLLEAYASEQAARMVTMQEASERSDRALAELRIHYNRLRRESITADLVGVLVAGRMRKEAAAS